MELRTCISCPLHMQTSVLGEPKPMNAVSGEGPVPCEVMLVGEAPGALENLLARPFVGRSGARLTALLSLSPWTRNQVYIDNVVKHQPPKNRKPKAAEIKACAHWLEEAIARVQPKVMLKLPFGAMPIT